jgi:hypothetical protein
MSLRRRARPGRGRGPLRRVLVRCRGGGVAGACVGPGAEDEDDGVVKGTPPACQAVGCPAGSRRGRGSHRRGSRAGAKRGTRQKPGGVAGELAAPGRQPAAPYGRKPTGRGAAAGRLSPLPQAGSPVRNAPTMTAPAKLAGPSASRRACSRRARHSPADRSSSRATVRARIGGGFAARSYRVRRAWYGQDARAGQMACPEGAQRTPPPGHCGCQPIS